MLPPTTAASASVQASTVKSPTRTGDVLVYAASVRVTSPASAILKLFSLAESVILLVICTRTALNRGKKVLRKRKPRLYF